MVRTTCLAALLRLAPIALLSTTGCADLTAPMSNEGAPAAVRAEQALPAPAPQPKIAKPTPAAPAKPAAEKRGAAHILIGYKGGQRSKATRSKAEAKKEAARITALARKPKADFTALAKKHSEGPSAPKGGDLGLFTRDRMVKAFSDATFSMKVDEVRGPIETPFGFHVIKRTK